MSRIDELIAEFCPGGVEFKTVGAVAVYVRGVTYSKNDEQPDGPIRVLRSNNITLSSNTLNFDDVKTVAEHVRVRADQWLKVNDILISAASGSKAHVGKVAYITSDIDYCFGGFMAALRVTGPLDSRFLFHLLTGTTFSDYLSRAIDSTTINNLSASVMGAFRIPVPPLEVQREIVRILDRYSSQESELGRELEAELEARRRQYAYYRDSLLSFPEDMPRAQMGDLGTFIRGRRFTKDDVVDDGIPAIHYGEIYTHYGTSTISTITHVRNELAGRLRYARPGDVVIAAVGETVDDVAKAVAWLGAEPVAIHDDTFVFRSKLDPKYVSYFLQTADFHSQKNKYVTRAKVKRLSGESLAKIVIPVPSLAEQQRIVGTLDRFEAALSEFAAELPVEIVARRRQYEHYREKLLTFEELAV